jgi:hypothetical protein
MSGCSAEMLRLSDKKSDSAPYRICTKLKDSSCSADFLTTMSIWSPFPGHKPLELRKTYRFSLLVVIGQITDVPESLNLSPSGAVVELSKLLETVSH